MGVNEGEKNILVERERAGREGKRNKRREEEVGSEAEIGERRVKEGGSD